MNSILNPIFKKHLLIYLAIGAFAAIGQTTLKIDRLLLTKIFDGLFAVFVISAVSGDFFWMKEK